jgi:hypothetical protein
VTENKDLIQLYVGVITFLVPSQYRGSPCPFTMEGVQHEAFVIQNNCINILGILLVLPFAQLFYTLIIIASIIIIIVVDWVQFPLWLITNSIHYLVTYRVIFFIENLGNPELYYN